MIMIEHRLKTMQHTDQMIVLEQSRIAKQETYEIPEERKDLRKVGRHGKKPEDDVKRVNGFGRLSH